MTSEIKVLIVDDAPFILKVTETLLRSEGFDVRTAPNGESGLSLWREWRPDLVLLDLMMPDKSGWDVMDEAAGDERCSASRVIIFSAKDDPEARVQAKERGAYAFVLKPYDNRRLAAMIREAVKPKGS